MDKIQEVATLLQINEEDYRRNYPDNDDSYKRYRRLLRKYDRFMPFFPHTCWACRKRIDDWYEAYVYTARPAVFIEMLGREVTFWVEKYHYPECPDRLREFEEEMYARQEEEAAAEERASRKAA